MTSSAAGRVVELVASARGDHLFQLIVEASPDLIYVYDRLRARYLFVSQRSTTMLGYTPDQVMRFTSEDIEQWIHPEDRARGKAHYAKQDHLDDTETSITTYRVRHAAGNYRLAKEIVMPLPVTRRLLLPAFAGFRSSRYSYIARLRALTVADMKADWKVIFPSDPGTLGKRQVKQ